MDASADPPSSDDRAKEQLQKFQELSIERMKEQEAVTQERQAAHAAEQAAFAAQGAEGARAADAAELATKKAKRDWQVTEKKRKADIEADKKRRLDEAQAIKERQEKEEKYTKERKQYFDDLHKDAARKALAERKGYEDDQTMKDGIAEAERWARDEKYKADVVENETKERIERDAVRQKDELNKNLRTQMSELFAEEARQKSMLQAEQPADPAGQALFKIRLETLTREMNKKRNAVEEEIQTARRMLEQQAITLRAGAEDASRKRKRDIDAELLQKILALRRERKNQGGAQGK